MVAIYQMCGLVPRPRKCKKKSDFQKKIGFSKKIGFPRNGGTQARDKRGAPTPQGQDGQEVCENSSCEAAVP